MNICYYDSKYMKIYIHIYKRIWEKLAFENDENGIGIPVLVKTFSL